FVNTQHLVIILFHGVCSLSIELVWFKSKIPRWFYKRVNTRPFHFLTEVSFISSLARRDSKGLFLSFQEEFEEGLQ
ncbi:MAG: hypothetical protein AAB318_00615, partial [Planctomycetota bacterium]